MNEMPLIKRIKIIPYVFLISILIFTIFKITHDIKSVGTTRFLNVNKVDLKEKTFRNVELGENSFQTGIIGTLSWKVKNIQQAFLIGFAERNSLLNYYDVLYFLLLDAALFFLTYRVKEDTIFADRLSDGFIIMLVCVILYPFTNMVADYYSSVCVKELTDNQFDSLNHNLAIGNFQIIIYLLISMYPFLQKAIQLEKDQNLTV